MKPWMVWPLMAVIFGLMWLAGQQQFSCAPNQIFVPRGFGGACVVGSWR